MPARDYDVVVIGSGGGVKIALPAAARGLKVALIECRDAGGTCLNRGCIPSKMLIYPTELADAMRAASRLDVRLDAPPVVDFAALVARVTRTVEETSAGLAERFRGTPNLDYHAGRAAFADGRTVLVNGIAVRGRRVFVATGSVPRIPDIPGLAGTPYMTSDEALRRPDLPPRLLVLGASYIAVELGGAFRAAGARVDFIVRSRLLRQEDTEIADEFARVFARHHGVHQPFTAESVAFDGRLFRVALRGSGGAARVLEAEAMLVAAGVKPATAGLGLEHTAVRTDDEGFIVVDACLRTDEPGVYAFGDVVGNYLFRHTANHEGEYLMRTAFADTPPAPLDYGPVPHAVFAHPQVAGVGLTEQQARAAGEDFVVGRATYADSTPGMARRSEHGLAKVLVRRADRRLIGAHIVGDEASDMIHLFIAMMKKQGTLDDLLDMIFIHPALPEVARDAARDARAQLA